MPKKIIGLVVAATLALFGTASVPVLAAAETPQQVLPAEVRPAEKKAQKAAKARAKAAQAAKARAAQAARARTAKAKAAAQARARGVARAKAAAVARARAAARARDHYIAMSGPRAAAAARAVVVARARAAAAARAVAPARAPGRRDRPLGRGGQGQSCRHAEEDEEAGQGQEEGRKGRQEGHPGSGRGGGAGPRRGRRRTESSGADHRENAMPPTRRGPSTSRSTGPRAALAGQTRGRGTEPGRWRGPASGLWLGRGPAAAAARAAAAASARAVAARSSPRRPEAEEGGDLGGGRCASRVAQGNRAVPVRGGGVRRGRSRPGARAMTLAAARATDRRRTELVLGAVGHRHLQSSARLEAAEVRPDHPAQPGDRRDATPAVRSGWRCTCSTSAASPTS